MEQVAPTQSEAPQAPRTRRRRRRRDREWEGYPPPQPTRRSGERIWCILNVTEHIWLQDIVNYENSRLQGETQYAMKNGQQTWARNNIRDISRINQTVIASLGTLSSSSSSSSSAAAADWTDWLTRQTHRLEAICHWYRPKQLAWVSTASWSNRTLLMNCYNIISD